MRLIAGCPIANREWAVPRWMECLAGQTRRPDLLAFVYAGDPGTIEAVYREAARHGFPVVSVADPRAPRPRHDNERFHVLAEARNELLRLVQEQDADLFLSLDSDIMLEDPETIERLERLIVEDGFDVAAPVTFLHPAAPRTWSPAQLPCWAYNFGFLTDDWWVRPPVTDIPWGSKISIDIPMAVWLGNRRAIDCRYEWHLSGEDVSFGQDLRRRGLDCVADTGLYARHIWCDLDLKREELLPRMSATTEHYWGDGPVGLITREHAIAVARNVAKHVGYAIAVHGSQIRDLDLLAVPWIEETAYTPQMLAEGIASALPGVVQGPWEKKPHGRQAIVISPRVRYGFDTWYIDLSVMHRHRGRK